METFTTPKLMVENPQFQLQKKKISVSLTRVSLDAPVIEHIKCLNQLPYCYSLQCCYGHFLYSGQRDINNNDPLPICDNLTKVEYRLAYIAFCVDFSDQGRELLDGLKTIPAIDNENIQFGCADWFWERQVNSYILQVVPGRHMFEDKAKLDYHEALIIETVEVPDAACICGYLTPEIVEPYVDKKSNSWYPTI